MDILKLHTKSVIAVGDLHGNFKDILYFIKRYDLKDTVIIFCGDIGIGFYKPEYYKQIFNKIKKELSKRDVYCLFIRGNHDDNLEFNGNTYKDKRIRTLRDYTVVQFYDIEDNDEQNPYNVLTIGGAISIDRKDRIARTERRALEYMKHHQCDFDEAYRRCPQEYWPDEAPFYKLEELNQIKNDNIRINAVCSHTCPHFCKPYTKDGIQGWLMIDERLGNDLDHERQTMTNIYEKLIEDNHPIDKWCYGHFHWHNFDVIDDIKFYLLDMDRNGIMDFVEIFRTDIEN